MKHLLYLVVTCLALNVHAQIKGGKTSDGSASATGQTWAVIVGISNYQFVDRLRYADKDAEVFYQFLSSPAGGSVPLSNMTLLLNEKATTAQIEKALTNLVDLVKPGDRVIIYFSGHGDQEVKTAAQRGFLLTYDTNSQLYQSTAYAILFFQDYITTLSTDKKATVQVYLDACRAGKLAGNEIGGLQLAGEQLAKQAANEIKLMACQRNEVSLEGEQWGGGRGAFSYHLVRGLQGLADVDGDSLVTTRELERYLEDRVSTEAKPMQQTPFKVGDANTVLARVHRPTLLALRTNRSLPTFAAVSGKGFVETALAKADTSIQARYRLFEQKLTQKRPEAAIADYEWLAAQPAVASALPFLKHELAAALMDEGQSFLNKYVNSEGENRISIEDCERQNRQFSYAATLLGAENYFYNPARARAAYFRGVVAKISKDTTTALAAFGQAIGFDSLAVFAYNEQGILLSDNPSQYTFAEVAYWRGLQIAPNWAYLHYNLGKLLSNQQRYGEAESAYRKSIILKPDYPNAHNNLGNVLDDLKRYDEAEAAYRKALEIKPDYAEAYYNLGLLMEIQEHFEEARKHFDTYTRLVPNDTDGWHKLGIQLLYLKQYQSARPCFERVLALDPKNQAAPYNLACIYSLQNQPVPALQWLEKALQNGYSKFAHIAEDTDLDNIRNTEGFRALLAKYNAKK